MEIINHHLEELKELCQKHNVKNLYVFGSIANNKAKIDSDIDLLFEFDEIKPLEYFDNYLSLKTKLEAIFLIRVDLVELQTVKNPILKRSIDKDKIKVYERENIKMAL